MYLIFLNTYSILLPHSHYLPYITTLFSLSTIYLHYFIISPSHHFFTSTLHPTMAFDFEKLLNDSMMRIYDKYKDRDDSFDNIIDINLSEGSSCSSDSDIYGEFNENFTFFKKRNSEFKTKRNLIQFLNFNTLYDFLFTVDSIDEILEVIEILEGI